MSVIEVPSLTTVLELPPAFETVLEVGQGPSGPPGPAGDGTLSYTHTQSPAATEWIVNHNFGYRPTVRALTVGGAEMLAEVLHTSANQARLYFDNPTAGQAICS
jgi:hypothetical protein